jgi:MFS family permease
MAAFGGGPPGRTGQKPSLRDAMVVFKFPAFRVLWLSTTFSFTGMQMQQVARALLAWDLTHSYGATGAIALSFGLPMLLFSLIGGAVADRVEKRNLVLATQVLNATLALAHAVLVTTGDMTFELLFILGLVQGTGFALGMPARTPLMAEAVGSQNMMSAIAMSNAAMNATRLFGPALAGAMAGAWGLQSAYYAQAALNGISAVVLLWVPTGMGAVALVGMAARRPQGNMFVEIGRGLRYVATDRRLRLLIAMMFITTLFAMPYIMLLAGFVQEDLGQGVGAFGVLQSISGIGAVVGSIAIATMTQFDRKPLLQWVAGILSGLSLMLLAGGSVVAGYPGAIAATILLGLTLTFYQTLNNTMVMDEARPEYYGRVMSINMLTFSAMPLMAAPLGLVADWIGAVELFFLMGVIVTVFMVIVGIVNPAYTFSRQSGPAWREADRQEERRTGAGHPGGSGGGAGREGAGTPAAAPDGR